MSRADVALVDRGKVLTRSAVDRDLIALREILVLEQRVDADGEVELDEEEENAKLRDLKTEKHSNDAEREAEDQEENVHHQVRDEKVLRALDKDDKLIILSGLRWRSTHF